MREECQDERGPPPSLIYKEITGYSSRLPKRARTMNYLPQAVMEIQQKPRINNQASSDSGAWTCGFHGVVEHRVPFGAITKRDVLASASIASSQRAKLE